MRQSFLVTGGCGFIGSHLCDALRRQGHAVRVLDDLSTGHRANLAAGAELVVGDVADAKTVRAAMAGVDGCFHLAAIASVERARRDWLGTHRVNQTGTVTLLDAIARLPDPARVAFVYASSAAVYGDCAIVPITEEAGKNPLSAYGADKYGCELHARVATEVYGIPTMGLRFFNVYGPRQDPHSPYSGVISIFCDRIRRGMPADVFGDGTQTRDFVCVHDVVIALLRAMERRPAGAPVLNVCTGRATSVTAMAELTAHLCGAPLAIRHKPARAGEIRHSLGSPARAVAMLALEAPIPLEEGLAELLAWLNTARHPGFCQSVTPALPGSGASLR